jgi:hypothetical protein
MMGFAKGSTHPTAAWNREKTVPGFAEILFAVEGHSYKHRS